MLRQVQLAGPGAYERDAGADRELVGDGVGCVSGVLPVEDGEAVGGEVREDGCRERGVHVCSAKGGAAEGNVLGDLRKNV